MLRQGVLNTLDLDQVGTYGEVKHGRGGM
jgi:hypothetical protein